MRSDTKLLTSGWISHIAECIVTLESKIKIKCKIQYVFNDQKTNSNLFLRILRTAINKVMFVLEMNEECKLALWLLKMRSLPTPDAP